MSEPKLKVAIYRHIPDLAGDELAGLRRFIADEFLKVSGKEIAVESQISPYDLNALKSTYLADGPEAYDVMEIDTLLLGELAKTGRLQALEETHGFRVTEDVFTPSAVSSVRYPPRHLVNETRLYGVPTLHCANFLMELADVDHVPRTPLLKDWRSFDELKRDLDRARRESDHTIFVAGNFRRIVDLSMLYLQAYVNKYGQDSVYEGIDAPVSDPELIRELKDFTDSGKLPSGWNPGTDGKFSNRDLLIKAVTDSKHIIMYGYSEIMAEALQSAAASNRHKCVLRIVAPPLDESNSLLTYTDAVVVNKSSFADPERAETIKQFVEFYTSLTFRTSFAMGDDLPDFVLHPRYVLPARKDFFTQTAVSQDGYYRQFHDGLQHSIPAPNHDMYFKKAELYKRLEEALGFKPTAYAQIA